MAKQTVGIVERHVEKAVLALGLICLIYVVVTNLLTSPNRVTMSGGIGSAAPNTIDKLVADQAETIREAIRASKPPPLEFKELSPEFVRRGDPYVFAKLKTEWAPVVPFGLPVPSVGTAVKAPGTIELADVVQLPKPELVAGRSTIAFAPEPLTLQIGFRESVIGMELNTRDFPVNWVTVKSTFDVARQTAINMRAYQKGFEKPTIAGVEVQRRARRPDGSWREEDWRDLKTYAQAVLPEVGPIRMETGSDGEVRANVDDIYEIEAMKRRLHDPLVSVNVMRPLFPKVYNGTKWPHPGNGVLAQDTLVLFPNDPLNPGNLYDRYAEEEAKVVSPLKTGKAKAPQELKDNPRKYLIDKMGEFEQAFQWEDENAQNEAFNAIFYCIKNKGEFDPSVVDQAQALADRISRLQADWKSKIQEWEKENEKRSILGQKLVPRPSPGKMIGKTAGVQSGSPIQAQTTVQTVWAHDAWLDSVKGGGIYQYRMRVLLLNPYAGAPKDLKNGAENATKWFLRGAWSEPSDPFRIEPQTQFLVRTGNEKRRDVSIDIYRWYKGVWVSSTFKVGVGDAVGGEARTKGPEEDNPTPLVDFSTGLTVVDVDFHHPIRSRDRAGRQGVKFTKGDETVAVALMDAGGSVLQRLVDIDRSDPKAAELKRKVFRPAPKAKEPENDLGPFGKKPQRGPRP